MRVVLLLKRPACRVPRSKCKAQLALACLLPLQGVSAAGQVVSLKVWLIDDLLEKIITATFRLTFGYWVSLAALGCTLGGGRSHRDTKFLLSPNFSVAELR